MEKGYGKRKDSRSRWIASGSMTALYRARYEVPLNQLVHLHFTESPLQPSPRSPLLTVVSLRSRLIGGLLEVLVEDRGVAHSPCDEVSIAISLRWWNRAAPVHVYEVGIRFRQCLVPLVTRPF